MKRKRYEKNEKKKREFNFLKLSGWDFDKNHNAIGFVCWENTVLLIYELGCIEKQRGCYLFFVSSGFWGEGLSGVIYYLLGNMAD